MRGAYYGETFCPLQLKNPLYKADYDKKKVLGEIYERRQLMRFGSGDRIIQRALDRFLSP